MPTFIKHNNTSGMYYDKERIDGMEIKEGVPECSAYPTGDPDQYCVIIHGHFSFNLEPETFKTREEAEKRLAVLQKDKILPQPRGPHDRS